ncbi:response regulator [Nocardioides daphniae]|uniref:Response regulator n=2 Tax=Nocardioides daphniae TaxID=402297 RepID=A0ABQ1QBN6_9ACTN|nr:response regulator [Nocardioides daphniae]GGD21438.1 response regulator [Nocardioides daphniae]
MHALVIDDSRSMRMILARILRGAGFEITEAGHGQEALDHINGGLRPDICLIDWNMPVMNGYEFVTQVRKVREWRDITLMMVTTESEHSQIVAALAAGAHEYVIKPFTADAILDKLELLGLTPNGAIA